MTFKKIVSLLLLPLILIKSFGQSTNLSSAIQKALPTIFVIRTYDLKGEETAIGTGFFIDSNGTGITNYHVLQGAKFAKIFLQSGKSYEIKYTEGDDKFHDIIRFKTGALKTKYINIASRTCHLGENVFTVGSPIGLSFTAANGIISSVRDDSNLGNIIQTTAPISHGCSGSPLINEKGDVIGIMSFTLEGGQNLNFAFSATYIKELVFGIKKNAFPEMDNKSEVNNGEEHLFNRFDWHSTYRQVKDSETNELLADNEMAGTPYVNYLFSFSDKPFALTYEFEGGSLSKINYQSLYRVINEKNETPTAKKILAMFGPSSSLNDATSIFQLLYGELKNKLGTEMGCYKGGKILDVTPSKADCIKFNSLFTSDIEDGARLYFAGKKSNPFDAYRYETFWQTPTSKYTISLRISRMAFDENLLTWVGVTCNLEIEPNKGK